MVTPDPSPSLTQAELTLGSLRCIYGRGNILLVGGLGGINIITNSLTQLSKIKKIDDCFYTALGLLGVARAELEQVQ